jgi:hypothetical protein
MLETSRAFEEGFGCRDIAPGAEPEVNCLSNAVEVTAIEQPFDVSKRTHGGLAFAKSLERNTSSPSGLYHNPAAFVFPFIDEKVQ